MGLKVLATSDLHIGMRFTGYPEVQKQLCEARFKALESLIKTANGEGCQLLVVAGDLFDRVSMARKDIVRARNLLGEFGGSLVAVLPGNHDFFTPGQVDLWSTFREITIGNVLVLDECKPYDLRKQYGLDAVLYPAPCTAKHSEENRIGWIAECERPEDVSLHIGVAHGSLEGVSPDFDAAYYPMTREEIQELEMDAWFLGHTHVPWHEGNMLFAGTPEPDGFDCRHEGSVSIVEMESGSRVQPVLVASGTYRFAHEEAEVNSPEEVAGLVKKYSKGYKNCLLKLRATGRLRRDDYPLIEEVRKSVADSVFHLQSFISEVREEITRNDIDSEFTEGSLPHRLLTNLCKNDKDWEALQLAYQMVQESRK